VDFSQPSVDACSAKLYPCGMSGALHGGAFWREVGDELARLDQVVRADVLDAWFPPSPSVLEAIDKFAVEMCGTSPEEDAAPLVRAISQARGIPEESILTMNGSSALIFLALPYLARRANSALVLDPMYSEYRYVLATLCRLPVRSLLLDRADGFDFDPMHLLTDADLVVLVNPNSPTGLHVRRLRLMPVIQELAQTRTVWIDETYVEYVGEGETVEDIACCTPNVLVCKSMSKVYALSGLRVGYLVGHPDTITALQRFRPPWAVSLPAQVCGALALGERDYYSRRYSQTGMLRTEFARMLRDARIEVTEGTINCLLVHLPSTGPTASHVVAQCARESVYLRDAGAMGSSLGAHTLRVSVRTVSENRRVVDAVVRAISTAGASHR
jgi:histidinol-phosphate/aromatic aminotransferase/cobyric acid decarboxylase-like protein